MKLKFDYTKLLAKVLLNEFTLEKLAELIGISLYTLSLKLSGKAYFKHEEIFKLCEVLGIGNEEIGAYFFTLKV